MGLFNDNVSPQRNEWQYEYTGQELLGKAKMLAERHDALEKAARNKTADLLRDCSVSQSDPRFGELKREISTHGSIREQHSGARWERLCRRWATKHRTRV